jgi:hypothetical protein
MKSISPRLHYGRDSDDYMFPEHDVDGIFMRGHWIGRIVRLGGTAVWDAYVGDNLVACGAGYKEAQKAVKSYVNKHYATLLEDVYTCWAVDF